MNKYQKFINETVSLFSKEILFGANQSTDYYQGIAYCINELVELADKFSLEDVKDQEADYDA